MDNIIEIKNLKKSFGDIKAVDDISFDVGRGDLFAFLGTNGAGKSTTINILCNILDKDSGDILIDGLEFDNSISIKEKIGVVFQNTVLDDKLTVKDNLTCRASFYNLYGKQWANRCNELVELLEIGDFMSRPYGKLSGGQKRRVDIARGLINKPKILFLDEPTTGLDPQSRRLIWNIINGLRLNEKMTIFLTTHYMEEAENANKVVIIDNGKIIDGGSPGELKKKYSGNYLKLYENKNELFENQLKGFDYKYDNGIYILKMNNSKEAMDFIVNHNDIINNFEVVKGNMDDVFLNATGKNLEA